MGRRSNFISSRCSHGSYISSWDTLEIWQRVTWLPYYQITHLQALTDYLELLRVAKISKLPPGKGRPPQDDPQVFLGLISFKSPPTSIFSFLFSFFGNLSSTLTSTFHSFQYYLRSFLPSSFTSLTIDIEFDLTMPYSPGVKHPSFYRISGTHYKARGEHDHFHTTIHVGQIIDFIDFDHHLRKIKHLSVSNPFLWASSTS